MPPPNTPDEGLMAVVVAAPSLPELDGVALPQPGTAELSTSDAESAATAIDYQNLDYVGPVDSTLLCPICRNPFHEATTTSCGHTFCNTCIAQALETHPTCPIDRGLLNRATDLHRSPLIIKEQLDRLKVRCPNGGCDHECAREHLAWHCERACGFALVPCPDPDCTKLVARRVALPVNGCLHQDVGCRDCGEVVSAAELDLHVRLACDGFVAQCSLCGDSVVQHRMAEHEAKDCSEGQTTCRWHTAGCKVADTRRIVRQHEESGCVFEGIGRLLDQREADSKTILDLSRRLAALEAAPTPTRRRPARSRAPASDNTPTNTPNTNQTTAMSSSTPSTAAPDVGDRTCVDDYMLARVESMEGKLEDLQQRLLGLDGQQQALGLQAMARFNEQMAEVNNKLGVLNMHTTWLMNMQRQSQALQQQRSSTGSSSSAAAAALGSSSRSADGRVSAATSQVGERQRPVSRRSSEGRTGTRL